MIPGLKIEFMENNKEPDAYGKFFVDESCDCYWLEGGDQILVIPKDAVQDWGGFLDTKNNAKDKEIMKNKNIMSVIMKGFFNQSELPEVQKIL